MDSGENARTVASARQLEIYGESWADRLHRLMAGYQLSQARLAAVIGLSAPMLSQLISGQRVKISNPAVYGRIVGLEEALADPTFGTRSSADVAELLVRTAASQPVLSTRTTVAARDGTTEQVVGYLATLAGPAALWAAATAARPMAPELGELLDRAARMADRQGGPRP